MISIVIRIIIHFRDSHYYSGAKQFLLTPRIQQSQVEHPIHKSSVCKPKPCCASAFVMRVFVASGVETVRHVHCPVRVDEEQAPEQQSLEFECVISRPVWGRCRTRLRAAADAQEDATSSH